METRTNEPIMVETVALKKGNCRRSKVFFNPRESMINTQLFKKFDDIKEDIAFIEEELADYLYDFDNFEYNPSTSVVFNRW